MTPQRLFAIVAVAAMAWVLKAQWTQITALDFRPDWPLLGLATAAAVGAFVLDALGWHLILARLGHRLPLRASLRIWLLSAIARYIPGGIWGYTSRAAMARQAGVPLTASGISMVIETLLLAGTSLTLGIPALLGAAGSGIDPRVAPPAILVMACLLHPRALGLLGHLPGRIGAAIRQTRFPGALAMLGLYLYYLAFWVVFGGIFVLFCAALYPPAGGHALLLASALPLAFFLGFVVVFVPGGLGLRESALYLLLLPALPGPACTLIAVGSRLWLSVAELLALAGSLAADARGRLRPP